MVMGVAGNIHSECIAFIALYKIFSSVYKQRQLIYIINQNNYK